MNYEQAAQEVATAVPKKAPRQPRVKLYTQYNPDGSNMLDEEGNQVYSPEKMERPKKVREPKPVEYKVDEEGSLVLDEQGEPIPVRKPRAKRLDANGEPVNNVFLDSQTLHFTNKGKITKYREGSNRAKHFESVIEGMTVGEYYEVNGGKKASHRYLIHQLNVLGTLEIR